MCNVSLNAQEVGENAAGNENAQVNEEAYLYPAGFPSADTLRDNEILFAANGWVSYGINDDVTLTVDWLLAIGAIPAGYVRYKLPHESETFSHALEFYFLSLAGYGEVEAIDDLDEFSIWQKGWQAWVHWNGTYQLAERWRWHVSAGFTYDTYQRYEPKEDAGFDEDVIFENYFHPDIGMGFEYRAKPWLRISANVAYGNTFYIFDQNPQKWMIQCSFQFAPFLAKKNKFLSAMRIELIGFYINFPDLNYEKAFLPLYPLFMWQWQM